MKIEDKKLEIIEWLIRLQDEQVIDQIDLLRKSEQEKWVSLSDKEKESIKEGLKELDEGKGIPHEKVTKDLKKKYNS